MMNVLAVMDRYAGYNFRNDTSHLLLYHLSQRGHEIAYSDPSSLFVHNGIPAAGRQPVMVLAESPYFEFGSEGESPLTDFDLILMRKDPPVNLPYLSALQILSLVETSCLIINAPSVLQRLNEKLAILQFPDLIPRTEVTSDRVRVRRFLDSSGGDAVLKRLDSFAGKGVARVQVDNLDSIWDSLGGGQDPLMVQESLPVESGEKRLFVVEGKVLGGLVRFPPPGDFLTNPDLGGTYRATELSPRERLIGEEVGRSLREQGVFFAGLDLIAERLTDVNITSPGLVWEWNEMDGVDHAAEIVALMERKAIACGGGNS